MRSGGYEAVRKRMAFVSEELAKTISSASLRNIRNLCSAEMCTIKPSLSDTAIIELLSSSGDDNRSAKMVLQILAESTEEVAVHG
jgi:hypothetical protein